MMLKVESLYLLHGRQVPQNTGEVILSVTSLSLRCNLVGLFTSPYRFYITFTILWRTSGLMFVGKRFLLVELLGWQSDSWKQGRGTRQAFKWPASRDWALRSWDLFLKAGGNEHVPLPNQKTTAAQLVQLWRWRQTWWRTRYLENNLEVQTAKITFRDSLRSMIVIKPQWSQVAVTNTTCRGIS